MPNIHARNPSAAIRERVETKTKAYAPMMELAARQVALGLRERPPVFKVVAFSRAGEFSPDTFELVDWITAQYGKLDALVLPRYDHRTTPMKMREFRGAFLDELVCAVASGTAEIIRAVGHHHSPGKSDKLACLARPTLPPTPTIQHEQHFPLYISFYCN